MLRTEPCHFNGHLRPPTRLRSVHGVRILCVGDVMLDHYLYGRVERFSPEAAVPILSVEREEVAIGGAGNVACNIASLGARCALVGTAGSDAAGATLHSCFAAHVGMLNAHLVIDPTRPTTCKTRLVADESVHLVRFDCETTAPVRRSIETAVINRALSALSNADAIVLSDYAKGTLTPRVLRTIIRQSRLLGKPVIVDPKQRDYSVYRGATLITPNRKELEQATGLRVDSEAQLMTAATHLMDVVGSEAVLVTQGEQGMTLLKREAAAVHLPAYKVDGPDVCGAGDTAVAACATFIAAGAEYDEAMYAANAAAAVVVGKRGTAVASTEDLTSRVHAGSPWSANGHRQSTPPWSPGLATRQALSRAV